MIVVVLVVAVTALVAARLLPLLIRGVRGLFVLVQSQVAALRGTPALLVLVVLGGVGLVLVTRRRRRRRVVRPQDDARN